MLDFSLLGQGPTFESALKAYSQGQGDRQKANVRNALLEHKDDLASAAPTLIANGELESGVALQKMGQQQKDRATRQQVLTTYATDPKAARTAALQTGDAALVEQIQTLDDNQRKAAAQNADELGAVALALKQQPPEARKAAIQSPQMQQWLSTKGFKPEQIAGFDPSDANLDDIAAQSMSVKEVLAQQKEDRTAEQWQKDYDEKVRHNKAMEGAADKNADSRRISATKPRAAGRAASSVPPLPAGFVIEK